MINDMKKWIFALLLVSPSAFAAWGMEVHLYTQHFTDMTTVDENEKNYGIGFSYRFSKKWKGLAGIYRNSLTTHEFKCADSVCSWEPASIDSRYMSVERTFSAGENYELGIGLGVADGYKEFRNENGVILSKGSDYQVLGGPYLNIGDQYSLKIRYMFTVASLGLEYSF